MSETALLPGILGDDPQGASSLRLRRPLEVIEAVLHGARVIICGDFMIDCPAPVQALCGALWASGHADCTLQVRDEAGAAVVLIASAHASARDGAR